MFRVAVRRKVTAFHHLFGGDWGKENEHHSHDYLVEVVCEGPRLDEHQYLFDISVLEKNLEKELDSFRGKSLNEQPGFEGKNPSVELFARVLAERLSPPLRKQGLSAVDVVVWEHDFAWASFRVALA
jgi:6-pyruvoyltetrahydropterin/6-carboxytetrahydropterin synthase